MSFFLNQTSTYTLLSKYQLDEIIAYENDRHGESIIDIINKLLENIS